MGNFLNLGCAAGRAGYKLFISLLLKILEARKPALKGMLFLAQKIVDHHRILTCINKVAR